MSLKNNVGDDQTGFRFRLAGEPGAIPRIEWDSDPVRMTAETILNQKPGGNSEAQEDVEWWRREILAELLDTLDAESREIVILRFFERMPARDIAEVVGSTEGAIRTRLHRILKALRERSLKVRDFL